MIDVSFCHISLILYLLTINSAMHNISSSDLPPAPRRRCDSEGKRGKSRPRPVSALMYPPSRGRSDTEPTSQNPLVRTVSSSVSTRNLTEFESPKNKTSSVLNRLRPRRRSKEGTCVFLSLSPRAGTCYQHFGTNFSLSGYRPARSLALVPDSFQILPRAEKRVLHR